MQDIVEDMQTSPAAIGVLKADIRGMQSAILEALEEQKKDTSRGAEAIVTLQEELAHMRADMLARDEHKRDECRFVEDAVQGSTTFATLQSSLASMRSEVLAALENSQKSPTSISPTASSSSMQSACLEVIKEQKRLQSACIDDVWQSPKTLVNTQAEVLEANVQSDLLKALQGQLVVQDAIFQNIQKITEAINALEANFTNARSATLEALEEQKSMECTICEDVRQGAKSLAILQDDLAQVHSQMLEALEAQKPVKDGFFGDVETTLAAIGTLEVNLARKKLALSKECELQKKLLLTSPRAMSDQTQSPQQSLQSPQSPRALWILGEDLPGLQEELGQTGFQKAVELTGDPVGIHRRAEMQSEPVAAVEEQRARQMKFAEDVLLEELTVEAIHYPNGVTTL